MTRLRLYEKCVRQWKYDDDSAEWDMVRGREISRDGD